MKRDLQVTPHEINDNVRWYEEDDGIHLHYLGHSGGAHEVVCIPTATIRLYLKRLDAKPGKPRRFKRAKKDGSK